MIKFLSFKEPFFFNKQLKLRGVSCISSKSSWKMSNTRDGICMRFCISSKLDHFCLEFNFSSNFELIQNFRIKKSELIQNFDTWLLFRGENKRNLTVRILSLYKISCIFHNVKKSSFDDFLSSRKTRSSV